MSAQGGVQVCSDKWNVKKKIMRPLKFYLMATVRAKLSLKKKRFIYLLLCCTGSYLRHVGSSIFVATLGICSFSIWTLGFGMWDLVPRPGIKPRPPALGVWSGRAKSQPLHPQGSPWGIFNEGSSRCQTRCSLHRPHSQKNTHKGIILIQELRHFVSGLLFSSDKPGSQRRLPGRPFFS